MATVRFSPYEGCARCGSNGSNGQLLSGAGQRRGQIAWSGLRRVSFAARTSVSSNPVRFCQAFSLRQSSNRLTVPCHIRGAAAIPRGEIRVVDVRPRPGEQIAVQHHDSHQMSEPLT